jgi:molybdenum cofactor cytidylyltransferase
MQIAAVILAAGRSSRMGSPKALLPMDDEPLLARIVHLCVAQSLHPTIVVLGFHAERIRAQVDLGEAVVVVNEFAERGQTSSLQRGLQEVKENQPVCLLPVDHGLIREATLAHLLQVYRELEQPEAVLPSYAGRRGHPAILAPRVVAQLRDLAEEEPAHHVIRRLGSSLTHVVCDDPAVVRDLDTPADHRRFLRNRRQRREDP